MKERAKNALKHDINVAGKTIPTMLIIGLFLVGGGSAALLSTFGTVTGEADVQQAIELESDSNFAFDGAQTAGETLVETRTLQSNTNVTTEIGFETSCVKDSGDSSSIAGNEADFSGDCNGIDTRYVEYFDNAGVGITEYEEPDNCDELVESDEKIQAAIGDVEAGSTVCVADSYDSSVENFPVKINKTGITLASKDGPSEAILDASGADYAVRIKSGQGEVTVKGLTVQGWEVGGIGQGYGDKSGTISYVLNNVVEAPDTATAHGNTVQVSGDGSRVIGNELSGADLQSEEWSGSGILVFLADNAVVKNNIVTDADTGIGVAGWSSTDLAGEKETENVTVSHNTVEDSKKAISVQMDAKDVSVVENQLNDNRHGVDVLKSGGEIPESTVISENNIEGTSEFDVMVSGDSISSDFTLNAEQNWFGSDGISTQGSVDASWKEKADTSIEAETTDKFGIVNEFAINLAPADYSLTTSIIPSGAEETPS